MTGEIVQAVSIKQSRSSVIIAGVLLSALAFEVMAHLIQQTVPSFAIIHNALTLAALVTLLLPAVYLIVRHEATPALKFTIVSAFLLLMATQVLQMTAATDAFQNWPVFGDTGNAHDIVRWVCLVVGLVLMMASLYFALIDTVTMRSHLREERDQLRREVAIRRQAEKALIIQEDLYRQAIAQAGAIPYRVNWKKKQYTFFDDAVYELTGYTPEELDFEKIQSLPVETRFLGPLAHLTQDQVWALIESGDLRRWQSEYRMFTKEGQERWVLDSSVEIPDSEGVIVETVGLFQDITDRKREEEAIKRNELYFRALTEHALDMITVLNGDGTIRYESPSIAHVLGFEPEEVLNDSVFDYVHPDDLSRVMQVFSETISEPNVAGTLNFRCRHKDGSYRSLESIGINRLSDPDVRGVVINSRDVTDRLTLEQQLLQSQKMEGIGRLAGGVAHDFNNLLTCIMGYSEYLLTKTADGEWFRPHVTEIHLAAGRACELTRQLLAFARKQIAEPRVTNLNALLLTVDKMLCRLIGEDIELITFPCEDAATVLIDPIHFEQVVINLAINARDAMPNGGKITVELDRVEFDEDYAKLHPDVTPGNYVLFAMSDTGCGMPEDVRAHIFEPFYTTKESGQGTGLGLAMCYGIIKQAGGHISVYSEVGKGTTFKIYLPYTTKVAAKDRKVGTAPVCGGNETILIVEDEAGVRAIAREALEELGYTILEASDGAEALALAEDLEAPIHLLLTDVVLPQLSGPEIANRFALDRPDTKILFMSGYTEDAMVHRGLLHNSIAFLSKPFSLEALARKVRSVLDEHPEAKTPLVSTSN